MRYLILSDIHSNLEALEAVLDHAGSVDQTWCLGDLVGYGPDPNGCVELLRSRPHLAICGNHDWATLGKLDLEDFNEDAREANLWNREQLTPETLAYLHSLPTTRVEGDFTMAHGSPRHPIWEYLLQTSTALDSFAHFTTPYCLVGHTHVPGVFRLESHEEWDACVWEPLPLDHPLLLGTDRLIINPGAVGQPRDGDPRASYAVLDTEAQTVQLSRIDYPFAKTQAKMLRHGLPRRLVVRLAHGW